jgi:hypothetical protein
MDGNAVPNAARSAAHTPSVSPTARLSLAYSPTLEGNPVAIETTARHSSLISRVISAIFGVIALILILHIVFVLVGANNGNGLVSGLADLAGIFAWGFKNLFTNANEKLATFLNYGLAALVYLGIGGVLQRLFRNLG